jgi:virginiamycin B lyase
MTGTGHAGRAGRRLLMAALLTLTLLGAATASAQASRITEFSHSLPTGSDPDSLTIGVDGNLWFVDTAGIGRITPTGQILGEFPVSLAPGAFLHEIVPGPEGSMWFDIDGMAQAIGAVTSLGQLTMITPGMNGLNTGAVPGEMTQGPNGTVWFTDSSMTNPSIGRISADGTIKEFSYTGHVDPNFESITEGSDGNIWFTDRGNDPAVVKVTPDGTITPYDVGTMPDGLTPGSDGQMWFTDEGSPAAVGHVPENGPATESPDGLQTGSRPDAITLGSDGNTWFADQLSTSPMIGRVTPAGTVKEFPLTGPPQDVTLGIDGNIWATQINPSAIDSITPGGVATQITDGLGAGSDLTETDITVGPDGNLWFVDKGTPKAIARANVQLAPTATTGAASAIGQLTATVSGTVNPLGADTTVSVQYGGSSVLGSTVSAGTVTASGTASPVTAALTGLPAGSTVFYRVVATNAYGTATGTVHTFTTVAPTPITIAPNPIPTTPPTTTTSTTSSTVGNQRIVLVTPLPSACTASSGALSIKLTSSAISGSKAAQLHFVSASLFLDKGVKHVRRVTKRSHGKRISVKKTVFTANRIVRQLPATPGLRLTGLAKGRHTLKVTVLFHATVKRHGHRATVSASKTLKASFQVC